MCAPLANLSQTYVMLILSFSTSYSCFIALVVTLVADFSPFFFSSDFSPPFVKECFSMYEI
jgi:hypothetical protein